MQRDRWRAGRLSSFMIPGGNAARSEMDMSSGRYLKKMLLTGFSFLPGKVKIRLYRTLGATIGRNVEIGPGSFIRPFDGDFSRIEIGDGVVIGDHVRIMAKQLFLGAHSQ